MQVFAEQKMCLVAAETIKKPVNAGFTGFYSYLCAHPLYRLSYWGMKI
jgi:hypothetical protein